MIRSVGPAVAAAAVLTAVTACSTPTTPVPATTPTSAATPVDWVSRCTDQVSYWTTTVLAHPDHSYDYQEMGLSAETYDALRTVLATAKGASPSPDQGWIAEHSRAACAEVDATAIPRSPGDPGWP